MTQDRRAELRAQILAVPIISRPGVSADKLQPSTLNVPCPPDGKGDCPSAPMLMQAAGVQWLIDVLGYKAPAKRTAAEDNNLGCAYARKGNWKGAKTEFERGINRGASADTEKLEYNLDVALAALAALQLDD